jgi:hypothetical protein
MDDKLTTFDRSRGQLDSARIDVNRPHELEYWSMELRVDKQTLKAAVQRVGPSACSVRQYLRNTASARSTFERS